MANGDYDVEATFDREEVKAIVDDAVGTTISEADVYHSSKVKQWALSIEEKCLKSLADLRKDFKYAVTCSVMQRNGAAFHSATVCSWDSVHDKMASSHWHNDTTHVFVCVLGFKI